MNSPVYGLSYSEATDDLSLNATSSDGFTVAVNESEPLSLVETLRVEDVTVTAGESYTAQLLEI